MRSSLPLINNTKDIHFLVLHEILFATPHQEYQGHTTMLQSREKYLLDKGVGAKSDRLTHGRQERRRRWGKLAQLDSFSRG
jgi:hypothetical protein